MNRRGELGRQKADHDDVFIAKANLTEQINTLNGAMNEFGLGFGAYCLSIYLPEVDNQTYS
jgi:hypothetical protein